MKLYARIKNRRESLKMSQDELAKKLGYKDRSTIAKIESGVNDLTQSKIAAIAEALNTTPAYLMGWEEESELPVSDEAREVAEAYDSASLHNKNIVRAALSLPPLPQSAPDAPRTTYLYAAKKGGAENREVDEQQAQKVFDDLDALPRHYKDR